MQLKVMAALKPLASVAWIDEVPVLPCTMDTAPGEAVRLYPVLKAEPASAFNRPEPLGLPQPVARSYPVVAESPLLPLVMSWKSES